jgi:hypothetical protein
MKKITLCIVGITAFIILSANSVFACSCIRTPDVPLAKLVKEAKNKSDAVFTGKVLEVKETNENGYIYTGVELEIITFWKGNVSKKVTIITGNDSADCGYPFEVGKTYLVYAGNNASYSSVKRLETTICSRTNSLTDAKKDIKVLGKGKIPKRH